MLGYLVRYRTVDQETLGEKTVTCQDLKAGLS